MWSDVCAARYDTSSGKLGDATRLNDHLIVTFAAVQSASAEDGTAVAAWHEGDGTDRLLVSQLTTTNGAWSPATAVGAAAWIQGTNLAAGSGKRTAVAGAQRDANFEVSVWASHHVTDVGWLTPSELSPTSYHSVPPVATIDADGITLVAWSAEDGL